MKKRILSIILAIAMLACMIPLGTMTAFAEKVDLGSVNPDKDEGCDVIRWSYSYQVESENGLFTLTTDRYDDSGWYAPITISSESKTITRIEAVIGFIGNDIYNIGDVKLSSGDKQEISASVGDTVHFNNINKNSVTISCRTPFQFKDITVYYGEPDVQQVGDSVLDELMGVWSGMVNLPSGESELFVLRIEENGSQNFYSSVAHVSSAYPRVDKQFFIEDPENAVAYFGDDGDTMVRYTGSGVYFETYVVDLNCYASGELTRSSVQWMGDVIPYPIDGIWTGYSSNGKITLDIHSLEDILMAVFTWEIDGVEQPFVFKSYNVNGDPNFQYEMNYSDLDGYCNISANSQDANFRIELSEKDILTDEANQKIRIAFQFNESSYPEMLNVELTRGTADPEGSTKTPITSLDLSGIADTFANWEGTDAYNFLYYIESGLPISKAMSLYGIHFGDQFGNQVTGNLSPAGTYFLNITFKANDGYHFKTKLVQVESWLEKAADIEISGPAPFRTLAGSLDEEFGMVLPQENDEDNTFLQLQFQLKSSHIHSFDYTAGEGTIIATCTADGCFLPDNQISLKISGYSPAERMAWDDAGALSPVTAPAAVTGLTYNGKEQTGVNTGTGYNLTGNKATTAGEHTATATLSYGWIWSDATTDAKEIKWSIAKKVVDVEWGTVPNAVYNPDYESLADYNEYNLIEPVYGDDDTNLILSWEEEYIGAGTYTLTADFNPHDTNQNNYELKEETKTHPFVVEEAAAEDPLTTLIKRHLNEKTVEKGGFMGRQGRMTGTVVSETEGRTIIGLTEAQLKSIEETLLVIGCDENGNEIKVEVDCAYTYFYDLQADGSCQKIEAKNFTSGGKQVVAFVIIEKDQSSETISGYGYYRLYNGTADTEENLIMDVLYLPNKEN